MVLVFILCIIVILITLLICMIILSTIKIEFRHFKASNMREDARKILQNADLDSKINEKAKTEANSKISKDYQLKISFNLFGKLKWIGICLNNKKIEKISNKMKWQSIDLEKMEQNFEPEDLKQVKKLQPELSYFYLESKIGVEDVIATSFLVTIISSIISILLPHMVKKYEKDKYHYKIVPLYINKNVYEIKFDCIIEMKMVHIINILYYFLKKRRGENHEQRASNRRSYGYSYE